MHKNVPSTFSVFAFIEKDGCALEVNGGRTDVLWGSMGEGRMWSGGQWWFSEDGRFSGVSIPFFIDLKIFHNKYFLSEQKHPHPHTERHSIAGDVRGVKEVTLGDPVHLVTYLRAAG